MSWNYQYVGEPDYDRMYEDYCIAHDTALALAESLAHYLVTFDDDGCYDPGQGRCGLGDGGMQGCEQCYFVTREFTREYSYFHIYRRIENLVESDWHTLEVIVDAPDHIRKTVGNLEIESLTRLLRAGYVLFRPDGQYEATIDGIYAVKNRRRAVFNLDEIPF